MIYIAAPPILIYSQWFSPVGQTKQDTNNNISLDSEKLFFTIFWYFTEKIQLIDNENYC